MAKIQLANGSLPRECLVTNMSDGGVRLHVEGVEVPDQFVLLLSGDEGTKAARLQGGLAARFRDWRRILGLSGHRLSERQRSGHRT